MGRPILNLAIIAFTLLGGCSSSSTQSSFQLDPGRRAVLILMPTIDEILLTNHGPGTVEMDLEDDHLNTFLALTFRSGDRHTYRERSLARIRFANQSGQTALIEFRTWGGDEEGFVLDLAPGPSQRPPVEGGS